MVRLQDGRWKRRGGRKAAYWQEGLGCPCGSSPLSRSGPLALSCSYHSRYLGKPILDRDLKGSGGLISRAARPEYSRLPTSLRADIAATQGNITQGAAAAYNTPIKHLLRQSSLRLGPGSQLRMIWCTRGPHAVEPLEEGGAVLWTRREERGVGLG